VHIQRIGIYGTDTDISEGSHPYLAYPRIMGHELAGETIEVCEGRRFPIGDTVVGNP
jgi:threonine dehydrogenase-like Zn-dependent dehydrogenase